MALGEPKTANELAGERTDLAVGRTVMAANRTLMAWVRTALSLISFGFTIYKFLDAAVKTEAAVKTIEVARKTLLHEHGPRRLGLMLIALGTVSMIMGTIEYFATVKQLNAMNEKKHKPVDFSLFLGIMIGLLGLFLFITILTNTEVF